MLSALYSQFRCSLRRQLARQLTSNLRLPRSSQAQGNDRDTESVQLLEAKGMRPGIPIKVMIEAAYRVKPEQIIGGPGWLDSDRYDM